MSPKINRLTKKKDFDLAFKKGESIKNDFLLFKIAPNHLPQSRFGFIVSKKVSNKATVRNKIKRRLRAVALRELPNIKSSADIIVIALPGTQKKEFPEIKEALTYFFSKLRAM